MIPIAFHFDKLDGVTWTTSEFLGKASVECPITRTCTACKFYEFNQCCASLYDMSLEDFELFQSIYPEYFI